jgi:CPA2 family monovalent cation:H+ antiporter-2
MHDAHEFLQALTIVLAVAALTTIVFQRLRLPVVLGYIIAGLIVGPHVSIPLVADAEIVTTLSELGVILLMFSLGLEFSLGRLVAVGPTAGFTALFQCGVVAWLGFLTGRLLGWTLLESVFAGAMIAISSTTIIAKVFDEQRIAGRMRELVVGILLIEDLVAVVFMAALTAVATGAGLSAGALASTLGRLAIFLIAMLAAGMLIVPRLIRFVIALKRPETTLVTSIGICFLLAYVAQLAGYSIALGAFIAGSLIAESGSGRTVEHLVLPVRDMFAAIFFVSVGMLIQPALVAEHWVAVVVFTTIVLAAKIVSVSIGAFMAGSGTRTAIQSGMSLAQIGEFSFIIAGLGLSLGATRPFLYPVAVAVSAITTLTTPWLIGASGTAAEWIDRKLPRPLQTFAVFYGAWLERLRRGPARAHSRRVGRSVRLLVVDAVVLSAIIISVAVTSQRVTAWLESAVGLSNNGARSVLLAGAALVSLPFVIGIGRVSLRVGRFLAAAALPPARRGLDLDRAPRRALELTLELAVALVTAIAVLVTTQPFLPGYAGPILLGSLLIAFGIAVWRSAADLEGHVRAGTQAVVEALVGYARAGAHDGVPDHVLADLHAAMPGLGRPVVVRLEASHAAVDRTLSELNLRGRTGATVLAIVRDGEAVIAPNADERLRAGDFLALAGTGEAVDAALAVLRG